MFFTEQETTSEIDHMMLYYKYQDAIKALTDVEAHITCHGLEARNLSSLCSNTSILLFSTTLIGKSFIYNPVEGKVNVSFEVKCLPTSSYPLLLVKSDRSNL